MTNGYRIQYTCPQKDLHFAADIFRTLKAAKEVAKSWVADYAPVKIYKFTGGKKTGKGISVSA